VIIVSSIIGILDSEPTRWDDSEEFHAFRAGLAKEGDGDIEKVYRSAENHYERLPELAAELVHLLVRADSQVLVTAGGHVSALAAKQATEANLIPIVFTTVANPVLKSSFTKMTMTGRTTLN
jgi:ABC-type uncharacterized transport system substrate-binding protein